MLSSTTSRTLLRSILSWRYFTEGIGARLLLISLRDLEADESSGQIMFFNCRDFAIISFQEVPMFGWLLPPRCHRLPRQSAARCRCCRAACCCCPAAMLPLPPPRYHRHRSRIAAAAKATLLPITPRCLHAAKLAGRCRHAANATNAAALLPLPRYCIAWR